MSDENPYIDINKISAEFIQNNLDRFIDSAGKTLNGAKAVVKSRMSKTYAMYIDRIIAKYAKSKSFFIRSEAKLIYDFFVPPNLSVPSFGNDPNKVLNAPGASGLSEMGKAVIVTGSGGSGKSMFMRHILLSSLVETSKIPVFVELRNIDKGDPSITDALFNSLKVNGLKVTEELFESALNNGIFAILLDGFDEVSNELRDAYRKEIQNLQDVYPDNFYVLSSRRDAKLEGWDGFCVLNIDPFELYQAVSMVQKLPFDEDIKEKFINALEDSLYESHKSFLSNPLLLSIMLLTYSDNASIPTKLSIFYSQAYESLFQKHDALKGGYQRDRKSMLDVQDFAKVFSAFCIQSYDSREFTFPHVRALEFFDSAKGITRVSYNSKHVLDDAVQAVCLLVEDGLLISFAHRSFQEYFAAKFISDLPPDNKRALIKKVSKYSNGDSVLNLLHEIDQYTSEKYYILPLIDEIKMKIGFKKKIGITHKLKFFKMVYKHIRLVKEGEEYRFSIGLKRVDIVDFIFFMMGNYPDFFPDLRTKNTDKYFEESVEIFLELYGDDMLVKTGELSTTNPFFRNIVDHNVWWTVSRLTPLIDLGEKIEKKHLDSSEAFKNLLIK